MNLTLEMPTAKVDLKGSRGTVSPTFEQQSSNVVTASYYDAISGAPREPTALGQIYVALSRMGGIHLWDFSNPASATVPSQRTASELEEEFTQRADRWHKETSFQSSLGAKFMHDDYQTIMAMGQPVIPLILARLKTKREHWFWALKHLAKEDVADGAETPSAAAKAWLKWGKDQGYID